MNHIHTKVNFPKHIHKNLKESKSLRLISLTTYELDQHLGAPKLIYIHFRAYFLPFLVNNSKSKNHVLTKVNFPKGLISLITYE